MINDIRESLLETSKQLKFDYDASNPEWFILTHLLNLHYYFPDAEIKRSSSGRGYHVFVNMPSSLDIRRFHREDKGRIWCTELRARLLQVTENHDIIYKRKGVFRIVESKGKLIVKWVKPPKTSEPIDLHDVLRLPFLSKVDSHRKRRQKWWRKHGKISKTTSL
jgi:hypothetical protein